MGMLVEGEWHVDASPDDDDDGEYQRSETTFRDWIRAAEGTRHPPEPDRYHLYVSYACPWAHRTLITRALFGLEDDVSVDVVDPVRIDHGWEFSPDKPGCTTDRINGAEYLYQTYRSADPTYTGHVSVPVLWDRERETIVNNESEEIMKMLAGPMSVHGSRDVGLYPESRRDAIDDVIEDIYPTINDGVYRAGFAGTQSAYEDAVESLFDALDTYDARLADRRYLLGESLTLADVCLFTTLYRFDEVYHTHFKCNRRCVTDYENLWPYLRDIYQLPGVARTCRMVHVKEHYYRSHDHLNPRGLVPIGPSPNFEANHDRDRLPGGPPAALRAAGPE